MGDGRVVDFSRRRHAMGGFGVFGQFDRSVVEDV